MIYTANWAIICHLPPVKGTRNNHWFYHFTVGQQIWFRTKIWIIHCIQNVSNTTRKVIVLSQHLVVSMQLCAVTALVLSQHLVVSVQLCAVTALGGITYAPVPLSSGKNMWGWLYLRANPKEAMIQNKILNHNLFLTLRSASFLWSHFSVQPFLPCDFGGTKEPGAMYFPTKWGAKECQNRRNHMVVLPLHSGAPQWRYDSNVSYLNHTLHTFFSAFFFTLLGAIFFWGLHFWKKLQGFSSQVSAQKSRNNHTNHQIFVFH